MRTYGHYDLWSEESEISCEKTYNPVLGCERFIYMLVSITARPGNTRLT